MNNYVHNYIRTRSVLRRNLISPDGEVDHSYTTTSPTILLHNNITYNTRFVGHTRHPF